MSAVYLLAVDRFYLWLATTIVCSFTSGLGFGLLIGGRRASLLAENNHWVGEEIEALKGADLDADVAAQRRERLSGEQPKVELYDQDNERQCCNGDCPNPVAFVWTDEGVPFAACNFCISLWFEDGLPDWVRYIDAGLNAWADAVHSAEDDNAPTGPRSAPGKVSD